MQKRLLTIRNMASLAPFEEEGEYYDPEDGYDEMSDDDDEIEMNPDHVRCPRTLETVLTEIVLSSPDNPIPPPRAAL